MIIGMIPTSYDNDYYADENGHHFSLKTQFLLSFLGVEQNRNKV